MVYPHTFRTEHSVTQTTNSAYGEYYTLMINKKVKIQPSLRRILEYVDLNRNGFVQNLTEAIKIKSISGKLAYEKECISMIELIEKWLKKLGIKYECFDIGSQVLEGQEVKIPSIILAELSNFKATKTVCFYGNLDVKQPCKEEWTTCPWTLTEKERILYGAGVACGKGPLFCIFHAILAFQRQNIEIPVNIKFIIESMRYQDNRNLEQFLMTKKLDFLANITAVVVCESEWIGEKYPCICYGSVGYMHFNVTVEKTSESTSDPKEDLIKISKQISDDQENIFIEKFHDYVQQITPDEERLYESLQDFDIEKYRERLPDFKKKWDKLKLLMHFWRLPAIFVGEVEECICDQKNDGKVQRKFILKIVPRQIVDVVATQTDSHIRKVCQRLEIKNKVDCELISASRPWIENFNFGSYRAARNAIIQIYKDDPNMIREDKDMKTVSILSRMCEKEVLVLPLGNKGVNAGESNENISSKNFIEGTKVLAAFMINFSEIEQ